MQNESADYGENSSVSTTQSLSLSVTVNLNSTTLATQCETNPMKLDLEGVLILSRTQLVSMLCRWLACVADLTSRRGLLNDFRYLGP